MSEFFYNWEHATAIITHWLNSYYGTGFYLLLAVISGIYLYVYREDLRYKFLLPIGLIIFVAINPILYIYVYSRIVYWRLFWMLPSAVLIGLAVVTLLQRIKKPLLKWAILTMLVMYITSNGNNMFSHGGFWERDNWEKVSQETKEVCDIILAMDENPRIAAHADLVSEIRQYAPEIEMLYGRNAVGWYITGNATDWNAVNVYQEFQYNTPNYELIMNRLDEYDINFIVMNKELDIDVLAKNGFKEFRRSHSSIIYYREGQ